MQPLAVKAEHLTGVGRLGQAIDTPPLLRAPGPWSLRTERRRVSAKRVCTLSNGGSD